MEKAPTFIYNVYGHATPDHPRTTANFRDGLSALEYAREKALQGRIVVIQVFTEDDPNWIA